MVVVVELYLDTTPSGWHAETCENIFNSDDLPSCPNPLQWAMSAQPTSIGLSIEPTVTNFYFDARLSAPSRDLKKYWGIIKLLHLKYIDNGYIGSEI